ncbi:hypothetical protein ElyMa_006741000 [Elysia marginata]|uniref:Uncharacterized protein n=1 Tax=Elysia marginata TaxID=1093978 RepID=A0AAV4IVU6_9GAST|nr:hypothetical protein ElyMa_006741000 [Elysia marginata]
METVVRRAPTAGEEELPPPPPELSPSPQGGEDKLAPVDRGDSRGGGYKDRERDRDYRDKDRDRDTRDRQDHQPPERPAAAPADKQDRDRHDSRRAPITVTMAQVSQAFLQQPHSTCAICPVSACIYVGARDVT